MAVRRETVRKQFEEAVRPNLEPGEQLVAGAYGASVLTAAAATLNRSGGCSSVR